ncbi:hypothetical protein [Vulcanisaeta distributa]|uniref:hypothetical protein n=1 Tax=Vulcanisaeta distributa TaxID=164451 RepID=UPI0006D289A7|nr:hypothetical protein [Vulcanisaeta distributa]
MRQVLAALSLVLPPVIPFIVLMLSSPSISLILIAITLSIGLIGLLMGNLSAESWVALIMALIISVMSQGYVPYILHMALIPSQGLTAFDGSIIIIEYSLILSQLYNNYVRYMREFSSRGGYDKDEVNNALNSLIKWILTFLTISLLASFTTYYVITTITVPLVDPFTALVIFAVTYIVISRYLLTKMKSQS